MVIKKSKFRITFWILIFSFEFLIFNFGFIDNAYALDLDRLKSYFLRGDYSSCINEGEKILAGSSYSKGIDELYYLLGLSYLKDGNFLRASDIFEIILREFENSAFRDEAKLGLGDTYFLRGDFAKAQSYYKDLINSNPRTKLKAQVYYRLSHIGYKVGDTLQGKEYLERLKQEFPLNPELRFDKDLYSLSEVSSGLYYAVQVGVFSNITNAKNLERKLTENNYPAYVEEISFQGKTFYRVRVGKFSLRQQAEDLEKRLIQEGYPTKICP